MVFGQGFLCSEKGTFLCTERALQSTHSTLIPGSRSWAVLSLQLEILSPSYPRPAQSSKLHSSHTSFQMLSLTVNREEEKEVLALS